MTWKPPADPGAGKKPLAPTFDELRRWRKLIRMARQLAASPLGPAGDLRAAANACQGKVAPSWASWQASAELFRLGLAFPGMNNAARRDKAPELARLADAVEAGIAAYTGQAAPAAEPPTQTELPPRRVRSPYAED
jgi:hypothetical protein